MLQTRIMKCNSKLNTSVFIKGLSYAAKLCLEHCATSRKVAALIPDGIIAIFHWLNPSGGIMTLGSTQPLTETNTKDLSWGQRRSLLRADNLTTFMYRLSRNSGNLNLQELQGPVPACNGIASVKSAVVAGKYSKFFNLNPIKVLILNHNMTSF
jgi:hypothetical protein